LAWQNWITSIACTANDDAACAVAAVPLDGCVVLWAHVDLQ
jgi:hypothetical protein